MVRNRHREKALDDPAREGQNDRAHEVHLSATAIEIIEGLPKLGPRLVFSTNAERSVSGFSRAKARLDRRMTEIAGEPIAEWILHGLRRTAATGMARLNIPLHLVDKILNHVSGTGFAVSRRFVQSVCTSR